MSINFKTLFAIVLLPLLLILGGCNSENAFSESQAPAVTLTRIDITPVSAPAREGDALTLAKGIEQSFQATGYYSDGTSRTLSDLKSNNWQTSDSSVGQFDEPGLFLAVNEGVTTVSVSKDEITSNAVSIEVTPAVMTLIQVTPSPITIEKGQTEQLVATATYTDTTTQDVTNSVTWASVETHVATVTSAGLVSGIEMGSTTLTATQDGVTSEAVRINVTPAPIVAIQITPASVSLTKGQTHQLAITATNSLGESVEFDKDVMWTSTDETIATVSESGTLTAVNVGQVKVTAHFGELVAEDTVEVTRAIVESITLSHTETLEIYKTIPLQVRATGYFSDGTVADITDSVEWLQSNSTQLLTIDKGLFTYAETGSTEVTASMDGALSEPLPVNTYLFKIIIDEYNEYTFIKDDVFAGQSTRFYLLFKDEVFNKTITILQSVENVPNSAQISDHYIQETIIPTLKASGKDYSMWESILESARKGPLQRISAVANIPSEGFQDRGVYIRPTTIGGLYHFSIEHEAVLANKQIETESYKRFGDIIISSDSGQIFNGGNIYPVLYLEQPSDPVNKYTLVFKFPEEPDSSYRYFGESAFFAPVNNVVVYSEYSLHSLYDDGWFRVDRFVPHVSAESDEVFDFAVMDETGAIVMKCDQYPLEFKLSDDNDPRDYPYMKIDVKSPIYTFDGETCTLR